MQRNSRRVPLAPALAALPLAIVAVFAMSDAQASGFQLKENSVQGLGRAFAGEGAAPGDCAVVVNNAAAMGELGTENCAQADVNFINFATRFHGGGVDALGNPLTGGSGGDGGLTKPVPALYLTHRVNDGWTVGASINAPFGFQTEFDDRSMLRYEGVLSKLESIDLTFSAAYRINDQFSVGASLIAQRTSAELTQAIDLGTVIGLPAGGILNPQEADGFGGLKGDDWGYGFALSALWKPTDADRIGFNWHSQIDHTLEGDARFRVPSNLVPLLGGAFTNSDGSADFDTPWFASVSWWHTANERLSFGADVSYTHWSSFKSLEIHYANPAMAGFERPQVFDWENTWFFSLGGEYRLDEQWTLRAGIAYDQTPTLDATRTPRVPDGDRTWLSFGIGYKASDNLRFDAGFTHLWVDDGKVDHMTNTYSTLVGEFRSKGNVLGISGQYRF